jgi:hypothetical protein
MSQPEFWFEFGSIYSRPAAMRIEEVTHLRVVPSLRWNRGPIILRLYLAPQSLIGALWTQFALLVVDGQGYRQ